MQTITISLPDQSGLDPKQTVKFLASKLYEAGKLSLGQAAEMAGLTKMAFAFEEENSLLILDDAKARKLASSLNLNFTGTLGLFLKAKQLGIIADIKPLLEKIQKTNFRFSESILKDILKEANE